MRTEYNPGMRFLLALFVLISSIAPAQTAPAASGSVESTFLIQADLGNNRTAIVQTNIVYPDTLKDEEYPDLVTVATEINNYLRNHPNKASLTMEALAIGGVKLLLEKFTVATGATVLFSVGTQGSTQITATRVAPKATPVQQAAAREAAREFLRVARQPK